VAGVVTPPDDFITFPRSTPLSGADTRYHPTGSPYSAMNDMWGLYAAANAGAVYSGYLKVSPSTFPLRTTFQWDVTPAAGYGSVSGYDYVCYGNYEKDASAIPGGSKQVNNITRLDVDQQWTFTGDNRTSLLCELFLDSAAVTAGVHANHTKELGFFPKPGPGSVTYFNSSRVVGSGGFTDHNGVTWAVRQDFGAQGPYYMVHRPDHSAFEGILPFADLFAFLKGLGEITGSEWVNGVAFGSEPRIGIASYTLDKFDVTLT
jgi:hypothetical protein